VTVKVRVICGRHRLMSGTLGCATHLPRTCPRPLRRRLLDKRGMLDSPQLTKERGEEARETFCSGRAGLAYLQKIILTSLPFMEFRMACQKSLISLNLVLQISMLVFSKRKRKKKKCPSRVDAFFVKFKNEK
jgi:hypothetical protein